MSEYLCNHLNLRQRTIKAGRMALALFLMAMPVLVLAYPVSAAGPAEVSASVTLSPLEVLVSTEPEAPVDTELTVTANIINHGDMTVTLTTATIALPANWQLVSGTATNSLETIPPGGSVSSTWQAAANAEGNYTIEVTSTGFYDSILMGGKGFNAINIIPNLIGTLIWNLDSENQIGPPPTAGFDDRPVLPPGNYEMEKKGGPNDNGQTDDVTLIAGTGATWISDQAAQIPVAFTGNWKVKLSVDETWSGNCTVEVGQSQADGSNFQVFGSASGTPDSGKLVLIFPGSGTVLESHHLALKVSTDGAGTIFTDGSSFLTAPSGSSAYPIPETMTLILLALGLAGTGGFLFLRRQKMSQGEVRTRSKCELI